MNTLVLLFLIAVGALVQAMIPAIPELGLAKVPVLAAIVVYYALVRERRDLLWAAICAGLVQDAMGLIPFGYSPVAFGISGWMIARFKDLVFVHEVLTHMMFGLLMAALSTCVLFFLLTSTGLIEMTVSHALHKVAGTALLGAVITPLAFLGCSRLDRLMGLVDVPDSTWQEIR